MITVIVARQHIDETVRQHSAGQHRSHAVAKEICGVGLNQRTRRTPRANQIQARTAVSLGVRNDWLHTTLVQTSQFSLGSGRQRATRKLDEDRARRAKSQMRCRQIDARTIEHDLPAALHRDGRRRDLAHVAVCLLIALDRHALRFARREMRRAHHARHARRREPLQHVARLFNGARTIVHAGEQMRVDIDHRTRRCTSERTGIHQCRDRAHCGGCTRVERGGLLGRRFERVCHQRIRCEQIESGVTLR